MIEKEKSYMLVIPANENDIYDLKGMMNRLMHIPGMELVSHNYEECLELVFETEEDRYETEVYPTELEIPPMYRILHFFPDVDMEKAANAKVGLCVAMYFAEDALTSYHAQLKIIQALLPDAIAVMDTNSEKILSGKWVQLAAISNVPPAPRYIYTVQAVSGEEDDCVWLHSHGLNRCGLPEMEILDSRKETYQNHYNIIETMANRLLEKKNSLQIKEPFFVARVAEEIPLVATLIDWEEAVSTYPDDMLGGKNDREDGHNKDTCGVFVYISPEDAEKHQYVPVSVFDDLLKENPIYLLTTEETERMKKLAAERLPYMLAAAQNKENHILIKIGLDIDEEYRDAQNDHEHIWFELLEADDQHVRCRLTQEPYYVKDMHAGSEGTYSFDRITDWLIYTKDRRYTADDVYLLGM